MTALASSIAQALDAFVNDGRDLTEDEAAAALDDIMSGDATQAQTSAFLTALRLKGETVDEIVGLARTMRAKSLHVETGLDRLADTCGTGGSGKQTFNVSTAVAFVVAGCGVAVAKHGNRAMTSASGSADVLEALGAHIDLGPEDVAQVIKETGVGFMFAQAYHPAMKYVAPIRRELGFRTVFNILGPLTNPAGAQYQVLGVATPEIAEKMAQALGRLGSTHALVVHGQEGLDEVSPTGPTTVWELRDGAVERYDIAPHDFHIRPVPLTDVAGGDAVANAQAMREVLGGVSSALTGFVTLNAAAALYAADEAPTLAEGVGRAAECIDDQRALRKLELFVEATQRLGADA
ncbi:MAG: anthranilate phosphoribosyltransferase [Chloroflexi bacterium]|nr:anthranilate phosphoribosyltransferase [Chloroflexota bacterium]